MYNPTRRNRNIGTSKQGHGVDNKFVIPQSWHDSHLYYEKLGIYTLIKRFIKKKEYTFLVEHTRKNSYHACTIDDIVQILSFIPESDIKDLHLIILRQPKRKEEILKPVWGRFCHFFGVDKRFEGPAIILEAMDFSRKIKWEKSQTPEDKKEFERLIADGQKYIENKNEYIIQPKIFTTRKNQLYRNFLQEIGHYVQYLQIKKNSIKKENAWYN